MQLLKWLANLPVRFVQSRCAHRFAETERIGQSTNWILHKLKHPVTGEYICDVMRRRFVVRTTCEICGKVFISEGYDQKPCDENDQCTAQS